MGVHVLKSSMTRGAISPLARARRDIEMYAAAAAVIKNWYVLREGGLRRRSGTRYRGATKFSNKDTRLVDFVFSASQSYAIEFGDLYVRFWHDGELVENTGVPVEVVSQYAEGDLRNIQWAQSGDVLYLAFRSQTKKPKKLVRSSHTSWSFQDVAFKDGPYLPVNDVQNKCTPNTAPVTSSTSTLTFDSTANINNGSGWLSTDVGRHFRVQFDGKWSWGKITTRNSTTQIIVTWEDGQGGTTASLTWRAGAFSDTTGYPGSVAIFEGRLFWASTPVHKRYIGFSYSNLPETFTPTDVDGTVTAAHGGAVDIVSGDEILWMQEAPRLQIAMTGSIRSLGASDNDQQFGPSNIFVKVEEREGVSGIRPVTVGPSTVHASRFERSVNDLYYDYQVNSLIRPEMSTVSEHLFQAGVRELFFQLMPHRRLWSVLSDGTLVCTTIDRYEKVMGFTPHDVGGVVISGTSIPGTVQHDLYLIVRRTIDGQSVQYVETLDPDFLRMSLDDAYFMDCGGTYDDVPTNVVTGVTWLQNEVVDVIADGKALPPQTISGTGELTLPNGRTASKISFGLMIEAPGELLPAPISAPDGATLGRKMRVVAAEVDVFETIGLQIISDRGVSSLLKERPADKPDEDDMDARLHTGCFRILGEGDWRSEGVIGFQCDKPLPATIRAFNIHLQTE